MRRSLLVARGGGRSFTAPPPDPDPPPGDDSIEGASALATSLEALYPNVAFTITVDSQVVAEGYRPAHVQYTGHMYTRDHAYTLWHYPESMTAEQRRTFATYYLSRRTTAGEFPADFVPERIDPVGTVFYKTANGTLPTFDGIHFVILALWADWNLTGHTATFTANQSAINACLAAVPRSANGCVYSDPGGGSVDYGFSDGTIKTGDVAYGTALQAWAYKMCAEMAGESGSGTYTTLRNTAQSGLATLRQASGWYKASSLNNAERDDVWATALIVAEGLVSGSDRTASATKLRDAYLANQITSRGWIRHLPAGQFWVNTDFAEGQYQNGGYWMTPLWDCYRAVKLVDPSTATAWATEAIEEAQAQLGINGPTASPWEWFNGPAISNGYGYTCHAALVRRFI